MTAGMLTSVRGLLLPLSQLSPRREAIMVLLILAESMIASIFAGFLLGSYLDASQTVPALLIFALLLVAWQVPHLLEALRIWSPHYEAIMVVALVATMVLAIKVGSFPTWELVSSDWLIGARDELILRDSPSERPVWGMIAIVVYAWWRGRTRAEAILDTAYTMLRWGIILGVAAVMIAWLAAPPGAEIQHNASGALAGFLIFTLLAIAIARQPVSDDPGQDWHAGWIWAAVLIAPVLAIMITTVSAAGILSRDLFDLVVSVVAPVFWLIGLMLRSIIIVIALVAFVLIAPLLWLLERHSFGSLNGLPRLDLAPRTGTEFEEFSRRALDIGDPVRYLIAGVILILLGWLLVRFSFRRRKYWNDGSDNQRQSLIIWGSSEKTIFDRVRDWLGGRAGTAGDYLPTGELWRHSRRVRLAYRSFLRRAARYGVPRPPGMSPGQIADRICELDRRAEHHIRALTEQYNIARYSGGPASAESANIAERSADELTRLLRELANEKR